MVNDELERACKQAAVSLIETISHYLLGGTERNTKNSAKITSSQAEIRREHLTNTRPACSVEMYDELERKEVAVAYLK